VRADAGHAFGILRGSGTGWFGEFLVSVSVHDSDRRVAGVILAQAG
jgi:hypothetical protein